MNINNMIEQVTAWELSDTTSKLMFPLLRCDIDEVVETFKGIYDISLEDLGMYIMLTLTKKNFHIC